MTDSTTSATRSGHGVEWLIAATAVAGTLLSAIVAYVEFSSGHGDIDWPLFVIIAVLLVATETKSSTWMRFGNGGAVTASWTFTFALMLLGSPTVAIGVMAATTIAADVMDRKEARKVIFNSAQISLSLAIGALVLFAFGIHEPLFGDGTISTSRALAMILSGCVVFGTNGIVICRLLATIEGTTFIAMMRDGFALSMSADAAMLAMAPILVITAQQNLLMLPLIGTATFFVYQTARQAIQRAHEANHDPLTQLLNRRAFSGELDDFVQSAAATSKFGSVYVLDLDRFKEVNDRLGHRTGDHVLQAFAERLIESLPERAAIARLGGDEFAVLLPGSTPREAIDIAGRLRSRLDAPLTVDGFPISTGTSIGVSHFPLHGSTPSELLHSADVAMYRAKRFRSGIEVYEALGTTQQKGRVTLLADLADAIENEEFELYYQPQVDMRTGRIVSLEALLRWNHPKHGLVLPGEFVGLAEQTDLIGPLTDLVILRAITDVGALDPTMRIAVNISTRNLQDRHFAGAVLALLAAHSFEPGRLEVEITESAMALEPELTTASLDQLRSAGVSVAIDDFGTGYSSFATLRELTVDRIKIDRSFITHATSQPRDRQIVRSVVELAHSLDLEVVAEGVETTEVWTMLEELDCDVAQGYLITEPMDIAAVTAVLDVLPRRSGQSRAQIEAIA